jgi:hypothetical protein
VSASAVTAGLQAPASTHFVSVSGNDSAAGTDAAPWRTIQRCVSQAVPGDTCIVGPGVFAEALVISQSGAPGARIRVAGQGGGRTTINGSVVIAGDHVTVEGFRVNMPAGATLGLRMEGRFGGARNMHVMTDSPALGQNNTAASVSGSSNTLIHSRLEGTCFGLSLGGTSNAILQNELTDMWTNGGRCGDVDYIRLFGANHQLRNNVLHGINRGRTGAAHVDCFQTFDNNGPERAVRNVIIDGNYCSDVSQGVLFQARVYRQSRDIVISNNVFTRVGAWCALIEDIDNVRILNNTCDTSGAHHGMWCRSSSEAGSCEFKNNIIYGTGTAYGVMGRARLIDGSPAAPGKNNLLFATPGGRRFDGYGADQLNRDPMFVDRAAGDFRLRPESPARDTGAPVSGWSDAVDQDGVRRPQGGGWDIGAYEFSATPPPAPAGLRVLPEGAPSAR